MLPVKASGIVPCSEVPFLLFLDNVVSANCNVNERAILFLSLCRSLGSAGVLATNGDGVAGISGGGGEYWRTSWMDVSLLGEYPFTGDNR